MRGFAGLTHLRRRGALFMLSTGWAWRHGRRLCGPRWWARRVFGVALDTVVQEFEPGERLAWLAAAPGIWAYRA